MSIYYRLAFLLSFWCYKSGPSSNPKILLFSYPYIYLIKMRRNPTLPTIRESTLGSSNKNKEGVESYRKI